MIRQYIYYNGRPEHPHLTIHRYAQCPQGPRFTALPQDFFKNEIMLHSMKHSWSRQSFMQVFDFESVTFKKTINMFKHMEISENIYEGVVEHYYKTKTTTV